MSDRCLPLYFQHIPKTAGTNILVAMATEYTGAQICQAHDWDQVFEDPGAVRDKAVFRGHFGPYLDGYLGTRLNKFTFFREPVARTISHYSYIKRHSNHVFHRLVRHQTLYDFVIDPITRHNVENYQARYIARADLDLSNIHPDPSAQNPAMISPQYIIDEAGRDLAPDRLLKRALAALDDFFFIGMTEEFDFSFEILSAILGWQQRSVERHNVSPPSDGPPLDKRTRQVIEEATTIDQIIYDNAKRRFTELQARLPAAPAFDTSAKPRLSNQLAVWEGWRSRCATMADRLDRSGQQLEEMLEVRDVDRAQDLLRSHHGKEAQDLWGPVLRAVLDSPSPSPALGPIADAFWTLAPDADGFSVLADRLEANGATLAAHAAQKGAALLDFDAQPAMDVWGGPFNGQERRQALFDDILQRLKVTAIVETGTFRGTTTAYFAKSGLPVHSCELSPRHFHYCSLRLAGLANVRLEMSDSRRFLRRLFQDRLLPAGPTLFYLDAHWEQDLPLWEEIDLIFSQHPAPVVMVDDFRVPADAGYFYDDYGKGKRLTITDLRTAVAIRPSIFFPNCASARETGARRGCLVLAQGDIAAALAREVPMLEQLSWNDALVLDGVAGLHDQHDLANELKQLRADREAELTAMRAEQSRLELRVSELGNAVAQAESAHRQAELSAQQNAELARDAAETARATIDRLHNELHEAQAHASAQIDALTASLRHAEERAARSDMHVDELQRSRWRRVGQQLGLARRASFER